MHTFHSRHDPHSHKDTHWMQGRMGTVVTAVAFAVILIAVIAALILVLFLA